MNVLTAADAIRLLRPGMRIYVGSASGTPLDLLAALAASGLADIELVYFVLGEIDLEGMLAKAPLIKHRPLYVGRPLDRSMLGDRVSHVPISLPQAAHLVRAGRWTFDAALVATSEPDAHGYVSLGAAVGMTPAVLATTALAIAERMADMPFTAGGSAVPLSRFSASIIAAHAVPSYSHPHNDDIGRRIGRYLTRLVDDGATLQTGPGAVANGAIRFLADKRNLRIHSDVVYDDLQTLVDSEALDPLATPAVVTSHATGNPEFLHNLDRNPRFDLRSIEEVADVARLAAIPKLVSITQAFAVDLTGQACCDSFGDAVLGGLASQPEFMRAAAGAIGGRAVLCLRALSADGSSAIRANLRPGEPVTLPRSDVHFVVTEFGIAYLQGKSLQDRALALIEVAAPDVRGELLAQARELGLIGADFRRANRGEYVVEDEREVRTKSGRSIRIRPARLADVPQLQRLIHRLPPEDLYLRFFRTLRSLTIEEAVRLCTNEQSVDAMFVAVEGAAESEQVVGNACLLGDPTGRYGEVGYLVDPGLQGSGLGRALQQTLIDKAHALGFKGLTAEILADNKRMLALARASGLRVSTERDGDTCEVLMEW
jgi:acyl-CoA hydrolase/RimJ/RimL family protein N-acetyltransferase